MTDLDLALIGNGRIALLADADGRIVWGCFPRLDGDPFFCELVDGGAGSHKGGVFAIELLDGVRSEQE